MGRNYHRSSEILEDESIQSEQNLLKVQQPFIDVLEKDSNGKYQIRIVFPLSNEKGEIITRRAAILQFVPENFPVSSEETELIRIQL